MPSTINPIQVQKITNEVGNFLGPNIAGAGAVGNHKDLPVETVVVAVTQEPERNWEYAISGTLNQDGFGNPYNSNKYYCTEYNQGTATFAKIIPV